ncbi:sulfite exporter TauE/SafE family protein [Subsaximicrobium wynnwilliamsii]|uniref:Probable membrane transporter protein n=1 Tax=Subsaximicrobium wynnwilliamsii TaxID=291179 RepID=A0A5C6ZJX4_9FLAO|nr:sulfite exporter TauE/SafE family protein [Subsaximicrobium wynnwilliamsii]TXD84927.1 sulfite exporter TauE/SafE family protein [Subsaximicrobium wynnwilliamsii]TXD90598.1 sulfite exporter TauE/SafE family protein [Subsaximicrobium wynnwilliamsii]TXE05072.1 sulfite exporter TauE/SafE family protein [Subsaximicrobium wynnwilliamsii]
MELYTILGYVGAFAVGLVLGLTGGGGSIITVPVLVYLVGVNPVTATAYSLFVVGTTSSIGAFQNYRKQLIDFKTAIIFAIPAFTVVYFTRRYLVPAIPDILFQTDNLIITKDLFIMAFFGVIMFLASLSMIQSHEDLESKEKAESIHIPFLILIGICVGLLTGVVGAGGGFLIIPALVLLAKMPMKTAIGSSLFIIALNSLIGFTGDLQSRSIEWPFLLIFSGISILGIIVGVYVSKYISAEKLKRGFGWFTLLVAIAILYRELF